MTRKLFFKSGNTTIVVPQSLNDTFMNDVDRMIPETKRKLFEVFDELEDNARDKWPVRRNRKGQVDLKRSKNSKDKMFSEVVVNSDFSLSGRLGNTAEYAWAIKVGKRSRTRLRQGKRVSTELLWKPTRKASKEVIDIFIDESTKLMK